MAVQVKEKQSAPLGRPRLLKEMVAIALQAQQIDLTLELLRERIERDCALRGIRLVTACALLDAAALSGRLAKLLVAIDEEEEV